MFFFRSGKFIQQRPFSNLEICSSRRKDFLTLWNPFGKKWRTRCSGSSSFILAKKSDFLKLKLKRKRAVSDHLEIWWISLNFGTERSSNNQSFTDEVQRLDVKKSFLWHVSGSCLLTAKNGRTLNWRGGLQRKFFHREFNCKEKI